MSDGSFDHAERAVRADAALVVGFASGFGDATTETESAASGMSPMAPGPGAFRVACAVDGGRSFGRWACELGRYSMRSTDRTSRPNITGNAMKGAAIRARRRHRRARRNAIRSSGESVPSDIPSNMIEPPGLTQTRVGVGIGSCPETHEWKARVRNRAACAMRSSCRLRPNFSSSGRIAGRSCPRGLRARSRRGSEILLGRSPR